MSILNTLVIPTIRKKHVEAEQTIDVGGTYQLTDNISLDAGVNFGLNKASNNIEFLMGISFRF